MKKLTITVDDAVYEGLYRRVGPRKISKFLERLARPHVIDAEFEAAYEAMAADEVRETAAEEWTESLVGDATDASDAEG